MGRGGNVDRRIELIADARCIVGEGPLWDEDNNRLVMVDIQGKRIRFIDWTTLKVRDDILPQQTGFVFLGGDGNLYGGAEDGIYRIGKDGGFERFSKPYNLSGERFNDGKVGPDGMLYAGTFSRDYSAAFYRMDFSGGLTELFDGVGNSNGLDWSPDGKILYYNDTPTGHTDRFVFSNGVLSDRREVIAYSAGLPDGMTIDADGNLWTALWGAGMVVCVEPESGRIIDSIQLPVSQVACCAFAGSDLKTLVITTAAHGVMLRDEPLAGATFAINLSVGGFNPNRFKI